MASRSSRTRLSEAERAERRQRDRERLKQAAEQLLTSRAGGGSAGPVRGGTISGKLTMVQVLEDVQSSYDDCGYAKDLAEEAARISDAGD